MKNVRCHECKIKWNFNYHQSEGSERIIQVPRCDDCAGFGQDANLVSLVVARLGADVSKVYIDSVSNIHQKQKYSNAIGG